MMVDRQRLVTWDEVMGAAHAVALRWIGAQPPIAAVYGVPRGGLTPAALVAQRLNVPLDDQLAAPGRERRLQLVVDDLVDSGATAARYDGGPFDALFRKPSAPNTAAPHAQTVNGWIVFPWEQGTDEAAGPTDAVTRLLQHIGEDPARDGLVDTPARVVRALAEMTGGYAERSADVLDCSFEVGTVDELVVLSGIEFASLCEHHMLPFTGTAAVGYLPGDKVVGLSKLARLVEVFACRLQVQERLTQQVARALMDDAGAQAAGVIIDAGHACMACRGVRKTATMTTSAMFGKLRDDPAMRAEFMGLVKR